MVRKTKFDDFGKLQPDWSQKRSFLGGKFSNFFLLQSNMSKENRVHAKTNDVINHKQCKKFRIPLMKDETSDLKVNFEI